MPTHWLPSTVTLQGVAMSLMSALTSQSCCCMTHCSVEPPTHWPPNILRTIHSQKGPGHFIIVFYNEPHVDFVREEIEHTDSAAVHTFLQHTHTSPPPSARDAQIPLPFHLGPHAWCWIPWCCTPTYYVLCAIDCTSTCGSTSKVWQASQKCGTHESVKPPVLPT